MTDKMILYTMQF